MLRIGSLIVADTVPTLFPVLLPRPGYQRNLHPVVNCNQIALLELPLGKEPLPTSSYTRGANLYRPLLIRVSKKGKAGQTLLCWLLFLPLRTPDSFDFYPEREFGSMLAI